MVSPVKQQNSYKTAQSVASYLVVQRYATFTVVSQNQKSPLFKGERVSLSDGQYGVVTAIAGTEVTIKSPEASTAEFVFKDFSLLYQQPVPYRLYIDPAYVGSLRAVCKRTETTMAGKVGWDLFYNQTLIAQGCDSLIKDVCRIEESGVWSPGEYRIFVTSFLDPIQPLRRAFRSVVLRGASSTLDIGGRSDKLGSLFLG